MPSLASQPPEPLFPKLSGGPKRGPKQMTRDRVARHQKARLEGAMVEAVARHGFAGTTLRELVTLAGVSKTTFYQHFESKQDCFLATFEEIVRQTTDRVGGAYRSAEGFRSQLTAGLAAFMELVVEEPGAAWLATVESLTLGAAGVAQRERASQSFELMIRQSFAHSPVETEVSEVTVRAIVAGIRGVVYRRLRAGQPEQLPGLVDDLVEWALRFQQPAGARAERAAERAARPGEQPAPGEPGGGLSWEEPPDSRASRASLSQRERIVRAAARVVVERGYESLSIPAISTAAGVSNQTFYENFSSKRDPFLAAFGLVAEDALALTAGRFNAESDPAEAVGAGVSTLLQYVATHELFARLAFLELPTGGPVALDEADRILDGFSAFLRPETPFLKANGKPASPTLLEAITTGIWAVLQYEVLHERRDLLPRLAPEVARIALSYEAS